MEDVGGGDFAMEEQEVVPNYVHPNTHISGNFKNQFCIMQDKRFFWPSDFMEILSPHNIFRHPIFSDNLYLRNGHLPLHILRLLLEGGGDWRESQSERGGRG